MNETTLTKMRQMKLVGMHGAFKAAIEGIIYESSRNIDKNKIIRLAGCDYIDKAENLLITDSPGVGKSYIASALGHQACIEGYHVMYFNMDKLMSRLKMAKADGSYLKEIIN
jgi:DNA replication protein DnaC